MEHKVRAFRIAETFFKVFGVVQFGYMVKKSLPPYAAFFISDRDCYISIAISALFTIIHSIITSERLDNKISIKLRVIICNIPCILMCGLLAFDFGLQELNIIIQSDMDEYYDVLFFASTVIFFFIYWCIERRYIRIGKEYDKALAKYKEKINQYELLDLKESEESIK